jgi:hypothetical protein
MLPGAWVYNWATLSLGDINTESWFSRLGVGHKTDNFALTTFMSICLDLWNKMKCMYVWKKKDLVYTKSKKVKIRWPNAWQTRQVWQTVLKKAMAQKGLFCQWWWCRNSYGLGLVKGGKKSACNFQNPSLIYVNRLFTYFFKYTWKCVWGEGVVCQNDSRIWGCIDRRSPKYVFITRNLKEIHGVFLYKMKVSVCVLWSLYFNIWCASFSLT